MRGSRGCLRHAWRSRPSRAEKGAVRPRRGLRTEARSAESWAQPRGPRRNMGLASRVLCWDYYFCFYCGKL